jgi:DNA-binding CsgD family transcriptional regulator
MRQHAPLIGRDDILARAAGLLEEGSGGVVLVGEAGIGKSRIAHEVVRLATECGFCALQTVATQAAASIPLGALSHLLPDLRSSSGNVLAEARRALEALADGRPLVISVDDAQLLDSHCASLLLQLVISMRSFVVATLRSGEPAPDAVVALWKDGFAERIEVRPLPPEAIAILVDQVLGGPSEGMLRRAIAARADGNPLVARELSLMGRESGAIAESEGTWRLVGELQPSRRLVEIVSGRLAGLPPGQRGAIDLVARGEPLGLHIARQLSDADALLDLERAGLVVLREDGRRRQLWLSHPVYADVVRTLAGPMLTASVKQVLADALAATGMRRRTDQMQVATWQLDAGTPDPALLSAAAAAAYRAGDLASTARLAAGAWDRQPTGANGLLLATALAFSGRYTEADAIFSVARELPSDDATGVRLARLHATVLATGLGRWDEAMALLTRLEGVVIDPIDGDALRAQRAQLHALAGRASEAIAIADPLTAGTRTPQVLVAASRAAMLAHALAGSYDTVLGLVERAIKPAEDMWAAGAASVPPEILRLEADAARAAMGMLDALPSDAPVGAIVPGVVVDRPVAVMSALHTAVADLLRGRPRSAVAHIDAVSPVEEGFIGPANALTATCLALTGRAAEARAALDRADARDAHGSLFNTASDEARAWVLSVEGQPAAARRSLSAAISGSLAAGRFGPALSLSHLLARLGGPRDAAASMAVIPSRIPGSLPAARRQHIVALAADDAAALEAVTASFADIGANLLAAEAATQAARAFRRAREPRRATRLQRKASELVALCEGATTPGLRGVLDELEPLSDRELEIATLAASGLASGEIAERLFISTRTVDNHLQHVYQKLGVSSRAELRLGYGTGDRTRPA